MKFVDFFAGIGGIRLGLERSGHQCVGFCEWDKFARQAYKAMYDTEGEWENHDIRTAESYGVPKADLWTFGFPCQDLSIAGKRKGLQEGERSGLFYEIIRLLQGLRQEDRPKWLLAENVKGLFSAGRVVDPNGIAPTVMDNHGLASAVAIDMTENKPKTTSTVRCLKARYTAGVTNFSGDNSGILVKEATKQGYTEAYDGDSVNLAQPNSQTRRGRVGKQIANTLTCGDTMGVVNGVRIRKLTPRECWRLQGFPDEYFDRAAAVISNSQLYKTAGNAVSVPVAQAIGERLREIELMEGQH